MDPSTESLSDERKSPDIYKSKGGLGFFGYIFLLIIIAFSTKMVRFRGVAIFLGGIAGGGLTLIEVPEIKTIIPLGSSVHYAIFASSLMRLLTMFSLTLLSWKVLTGKK